MSIDVFVGVGHGVTPEGKFDPGAVFTGTDPDFVEHTKAHAVVEAVGEALARNHVTAFLESDAGAGHDPNFKGSAKTANAQGATLAIEVHLNAGGGTGPEALCRPGSQAESFANNCAKLLASALGLPNRGVQHRTDLGFLNGTTMPACIPEVCFVDSAADRDAFDAQAAGEAIAEAAVEFLGKSFVPADGDAPEFVTRLRVRNANGKLTDEMSLSEALDALEKRVKDHREEVKDSGEAMEWGLRLVRRHD